MQSTRCARKGQIAQCDQITQKGKIMATRSPKDIALEFGTDAKTLRKFLRSDAKGKGAETPGKGHRWEIEARSVKSLQKRFNAWNEARSAKSPIDEEITENE